MKNLYRKLFYHWRAKYLCGWFGIHRAQKDTNLEIVTSYICIDCARYCENEKGLINDFKRAGLVYKKSKTPAVDFIVNTLNENRAMKSHAIKPFGKEIPKEKLGKFYE